jgi:hypothetical protein
MTPQHEGEGSVNPAANLASSTAGSGTSLKMTPNAFVRAASIHNAELGGGNDDKKISYRVYGDYDLGWEDNMEKKELVRTILSMKVSEVKDFLAVLEKQREPTIKTFTECLRGLPPNSATGNVRVLYG